MEKSADIPTPTRRRFVTGLAATPLLTGILGYHSDRTYPDADHDGIPDDLKRSPQFHHTLTGLFGDQFEGLQIGRRDFLLDVRYVGDVTVPGFVKRKIERVFRDNGIYLQWLDYPDRYDSDVFHTRYGNNTRRILWSRDCFYREEIEDELRDTAMQLIMVPGKRTGRFRGRIYSPWAHATGSRAKGYINGMNFGNRAVAAERHEPWEQARLIFHEIAHLALCHDDDPNNSGVMGTNETLTLTDVEWQILRDNLSNIRDTTGYDLLLRSCLWLDDPGGSGRGGWTTCGQCNTE